MKWQLGLVFATLLWMCDLDFRLDDGLAYEIETHRAISETAVTRASVDSALTQFLGLPGGIKTEVGGLRLLNWIREGSVHADDWTYFFNHFHNPLADWSAAGYGTGESAILWGQRPDQGYPSWGWQNTRQYFLDALRSTKKADRDEALKNTFQGLGHLIHLIQDMGSPAHTRNDPHVRYNYDSLVRDVQGAENPAFLDWLNQPYAGPDPGWQTLEPNPLAPIPIARLFDTDRYNGTNPEVTVEPRMGLAEYTNANFLSEDRIFTENDLLWRFPYPRRSGESSVTAADYDIILSDGTSVRRQYFRKDRHGDTGYRLATVGVLEDYLQRYRLDSSRYRRSPALDESVYRDYAGRLLPRTVGYSTALLDYFFRGKLEVTIGADPADQQGLLLTGKNASAEALKDGTLKVYGDYVSEGRRELGSWTISGSVAPGGDLPGQPLSFRPPTDRPVPERYMVVYQGDLGEEKKDNPAGFGGAVIGKAAKYVGVLEQLFVNEADGDVYFRNGTLVTRLNVRAQLLPGSLVSLRSWGTRNDSFLVEGHVPGEGVSRFYVFTLNRPRPGQVFVDPPTATLFRGPELLDLPWFQGLPLGSGGITPYGYWAALDDNLDVILPGSYVVYSPNPYDAYLTEIHGVLVNNTTRTVLFDLKTSALGAPTPDSGPGPSAQSDAVPVMMLRLDAARPAESRIVVAGSQVDRTGLSLGYLGIVDGNGIEVARLLDWEPFHMPYLRAGLPQRGGRHLLWVKFDENDREGTNTQTYLTYLNDGTSTQIGVGDAEWDLVGRASLLIVAPDYLLRTASPAYFVRGWTATGTVVLPSVTTAEFPPEDPDLASLKRLADPPAGVSIPSGTFCSFGFCSLWQVIEDPDMLR